MAASPCPELPEPRFSLMLPEPPLYPVLPRPRRPLVLRTPCLVSRFLSLIALSRSYLRLVLLEGQTYSAGCSHYLAGQRHRFRKNLTAI
jgi:hypothetical protein